MGRCISKPTLVADGVCSQCIERERGRAEEGRLMSSSSDSERRSDERVSTVCVSVSKGVCVMTMHHHGWGMGIGSRAHPTAVAQLLLPTFGAKHGPTHTSCRRCFSTAPTSLPVHVDKPLSSGPWPRTVPLTRSFHFLAADLPKENRVPFCTVMSRVWSTYCFHPP